MINKSKRRKTTASKTTKITERGRENAKGREKEKKRGKGKESVRGNVNGRGKESAVIREVEAGATIEKEAGVAVMAVGVIEGRLHRLRLKREETTTITEITSKEKTTTLNFHCKNRPQT